MRRTAESRKKMGDANVIMNGGPVGLSTGLPIPFVNGLPADYQTMSTEQLRKLINFSYKSFTGKELGSSSNGVEKCPAYWSENVSFDKHLKIQATGPRMREQQKQLVMLVKNWYAYHGHLQLLALGSELSINASPSLFRRDGNYWRLLDSKGRTLVTVDNETRTYDTNGKCRFVLTAKDVKINGITEVNNNNDDSRALAPKKVGKRKLFDEEILTAEPILCKFCKKPFQYQDFCEDHEEACEKSPKNLNTSQMSFLQAMGLVQNSKPKTDDSFSKREAEPIYVSANLRKLPQRNQLLSVMRRNPIPLSSTCGQKFVAELGGKIVPTYPPTYDKNLHPRSGYKAPVGKFNTVTKRIIQKHGEHPHIYTYGKRQREVRRQELIIGLSQTSWPLYNSLKTAEIVVPKLPPSIKITLPHPSVQTSHLERTLQVAVKFPRILLSDCKLDKSPDVAKYFISANRDKIATKLHNPLVPSPIF